MKHFIVFKIVAVILLLLSSCIQQGESDLHKRFRNYEFQRKDVVVNKLDTSEVLIILEPKDRAFWEDSMVPEYYCLDRYGNKVDRYELQLKLTHR